MEVSSDVIASGGLIPSRYTCDGEDVNPAIQFSNVPRDAKSLVLIMDDPDSPAGTWIHWLVWNIHPNTSEIRIDDVPAGAVEGTNSFHSIGYRGPCPGDGVHRYVFKLFALSATVDLPPSSTASDLEDEMRPHVIDQANYMGIYERIKQ